MPDDTTILSLPLILPAQAQKHVTHNEALVKLDLMVQLAVINRTLTAPPALPTIGDRHIVAAGATGAWVGQAGRIALFTEAGWQFTQPLAGWQAYVMAESQMAFYNGLSWIALSDGPFTVGRLGVSASPDATNRLAVSAPATLLNHAGAGQQLKLNKAVAGDTASLLFQTGFGGRAEMGTAGSDDFSVKVSADGSSWSVALTSDAATGEVTLPQPLHLGGQAADPAAPADGTLWLNTTTGEVKVRSAGVTQVVGGAGGGVADGDKGDITVSGLGAVWSIDVGAVTLGKMADLATSTLLGRASAGTGVPEALTAAQVRTLLNVANGATANAADAVLLDRANHTGTQAASTITGLAAVATSGSAGDLTSGVLPAARFDDTAHGARAGGTLHAVATTSAAGFLSASDKTKLDGIAAGANNYVHPNHSGDVTSAGDGATTIAANAVGFTKLADIATDSLIGRDTAGTGDPEAITVTGGIEFSGSGAIRTSAFTGDVTKAAGGTALTIATNAVDNSKAADMAANTIKANATAATADPGDLAVGTNTVVGRVAGNIVAAQVVDAQIAAATITNAKLANVAAATLKGRATAGAGAPEDLTGTQATALLDTFTSAAKGLAPASGGGTVNFLRADGTWAAPAAGGGGTPAGGSGEIQFNNAGSFGGAVDAEIEGGQLRLPAIGLPTAPASGGLKFFATSRAGQPWPAFQSPTSGEAHPLQPLIANGNYALFMPAVGTTLTNLGMSPATAGTATGLNVAAGSRLNRMKRVAYRVTTAATTAVASWRNNASQLTIGGGNAWEGGFWGVMHGGPDTGVTNASHRFFMGLGDTAAPTDVNPSTQLRIAGIGYDAADSQVQFMHNDGTGTATKIALGASFPKPNADSTFAYRLRLYSPPGSTQSLSYEVTNLGNGATASGTVTTDLPALTDFVTPKLYTSVGGVSAVTGVMIGPIMFQTED